MASFAMQGTCGKRNCRHGKEKLYLDAPIHCQAFGCVVLGWLSS